jgi:hypothetical protein
LSRRSRALALAGLSLSLLATAGCAHSGVAVRTPEADNTDLPRDGLVQVHYPHVTSTAPPVVVYPDGPQQK